MKGREARPLARPEPLDVDRAAVEAARRDPLRFETLYRKYVAQVYSFALYETRDHHAAEDVTEQVFLQALRGLPGFTEARQRRRLDLPCLAVPHLPERHRHERRYEPPPSRRPPRPGGRGGGIGRSRGAW